MQGMRLSLFSRSELRASIALAVLIILLSSISILLRLSAHFDFSAHSGIGVDEAESFSLTLAIIVVVALGFTGIYLQARCRVLEKACDVDNHAALHDPLTGAANRRQFERHLELLIADNTPEHALLMIDLDRFKPVNDLYGHAAGDALLQEITKGLRGLVKPGDLVARLGGDEFVLLLKRTTGNTTENTALAVLDFITKYRLNWEGHRISVGTSIGLINIDRTGLTASMLLSAADEALYSAKETGRGAVFSATLGSDAAQSPAIVRIDDGTPEPVSSARSHEPLDGRRPQLYGVVMAWTPAEKPTGQQKRMGSRRRRDIVHWINVVPLTIGDDGHPGIKMHELLVDAAARSDGGADFARWMLKMSLDAASRLSPTELGRIGFVVPLPARAVIVVPGLADELMRINALARLPIRHLTFVLHNIASLYDSPAIGRFHQRISSSDVQLGYEIHANTLDVLAPLRHVSYDELHLGRELVMNLRPDSTSTAVIEALLSVAERNGTTLVAPAVDSVEEARHLAALGVNRFAGQVVGQLQPLHDVLQRLKER